MKELTKLDDSTLYSIEPSDADLGWEILSRPQTMRVIPPIPTATDLKRRIEYAIANGGGAFVVIGDPHSYPGGLLLYETVRVNNEDIKALTFSFDRCLSGREWAQKCINWLKPHFPVEERAVLIGSKMSNSERLAEAFGLHHRQDFEINGETCRLFQK